MIIDLNGHPYELDPHTTVAALIHLLTGSGRGSAVVVDGEVVPRSSWPDRTLADGAAVELITAVQGG